MKKELKTTLIVFMIILTILVLCIVWYKFIYEKKVDEGKANVRYEEILKAFEAGVDWNLKATNPNGCQEKGYEDVTISYKSRITSDVLISNGYIKMVDMLDVDEQSYCTAYAETDCEGDKIVYKSYLKCKDYTTDGYAKVHNGL